MKLIRLLLIGLLCIITTNVRAIITDKYYFDEEHYADYYYDDSYFEKEEENHLRTFSLFLSLSDEKIMNNIGLSNISSILNDDTTYNTTGSIIGNKKLGDSNLIVVLIKSYINDLEWLSNFTIGNDGNAYGFNEAANKVIDRLKKYIKTNNLTNNKILITGYSRAGAISNLMGLYINEHLDEFNLSSDDLYVYTFLAPNSSNINKVYDNIHNIVNYNDLVPNILSNNYELYSNGVVLDITKNKTIMAKNLNVLKLDLIDIKEINKKEFITTFIDYLSKEILSREKYYSIEKDVTNLLNIYFKNKDNFNDIMSIFNDSFNEYIYTDDEINKEKVLNMIKILSSDNEDNINNLCISILKIVDTKYDNIKDLISISTYNSIKESLLNIFITIHPFIKYDLVYKDGNNSYVLYNLSTLFGNIESIINEHYPIVTFNLIKELDTNYNNKELNTGNIYVDNNLISEKELNNMYTLTSSALDKLYKAENLRLDTQISYLTIDNLNEEEKKLVDNKNEVVKVLEINITKTIGGISENITNINTNKSFTFRLSNNEYENNKKYKVLKMHNGEISKINSIIKDYDELSIDEILSIETQENITDEELKTSKYITFETNEFSKYLLVKKNKNIVVVAIIIILVTSIILFLIKKDN